MLRTPTGLQDRNRGKRNNRKEAKRRREDEKHTPPPPPPPPPARERPLDGTRKTSPRRTKTDKEDTIRKGPLRQWRNEKVRVHGTRVSARRNTVMGSTTSQEGAQTAGRESGQAAQGSRRGASTALVIQGHRASSNPIMAAISKSCSLARRTTLTFKSYTSSPPSRC